MQWRRPVEPQIGLLPTRSGPGDSWSVGPLPQAGGRAASHLPTPAPGDARRSSDNSSTAARRPATVVTGGYQRLPAVTDSCLISRPSHYGQPPRFPAAIWGRCVPGPPPQIVSR